MFGLVSESMKSEPNPSIITSNIRHFPPGFAVRSNQAMSNVNGMFRASSNPEYAALQVDMIEAQQSVVRHQIAALHRNAQTLKSQEHILAATIMNEMSCLANSPNNIQGILRHTASNRGIVPILPDSTVRFWLMELRIFSHLNLADLVINLARKPQ